MAEWLVEDGIGERRAALLEHGRLVEMALEWDDDPRPLAGAVLAARLLRRADATGRGLVRLDGAGEALLSPVPPGLAEGATLLATVVREALPEAGALKPVRVRPAPPDAAPRPGLDLLARVEADGRPWRRPARGGDGLDAFGWAEALEEAAAGVVAGPGLLLRIDLAAAMTLIDVDGGLAPAELAVAGARAAGEAIRRFGIAGSIGIDLPTLNSKAERQAAAAAFDAALPPPFERTGVNGFGFLQLVRRRERRSLPERLRADPVGAAARALVRAAERAAGAGPVTLSAHPRVLARVEAGPGWLDRLAAGLGAAVALRPDPALAISGGHAARLHP